MSTTRPRSCARTPESFIPRRKQRVGALYRGARNSPRSDECSTAQRDVRADCDVHTEPRPVQPQATVQRQGARRAGVPRLHPLAAPRRAGDRLERAGQHRPQGAEITARPALRRRGGDPARQPHLPSGARLLWCASHPHLRGRPPRLRQDSLGRYGAGRVEPRIRLRPGARLDRPLRPNGLASTNRPQRTGSASAIRMPRRCFPDYSPGRAPEIAEDRTVPQLTAAMCRPRSGRRPARRPARTSARRSRRHRVPR